MLSRVSLAISVLLLLSSTALAQSSAAASERTRAQSFPAPPVLARAGVVMDADSGQILASRNPHLRLPMASTTKIMTAVVALQLGRLDDRIVVPGAAFNYEWDATVMGLHTGQRVTLRDLLYGLMLPSGADAANTIAIHYGGSEAGFVAMMNREAAQLGMRDTHYVNAHGLTAPGHYSSAYDLALLARYASAMPDLMKITATKTYSWNGHVLTNVNHVLFWYPGLDGIKPGFTDDAGLCQVLDAHRNGRHVIVTLLNTPNLDTDARNLLNFGLRDFTWVKSWLPGDWPGITQTGADRSGSWIYFPSSGHYIRGQFLDAYRADGGAATMGFPRTEQLSEGGSTVQYFQNAALMRSASGRIVREPLGLTAVPTPTVRPSPSPTPTATPQGPPLEATLAPPPGIRGSPTASTRTTATPRPASPRPTLTPHPVTPAPSPTPRPTAPAVTASVFQTFQRAHASLLGAPVTPLRTAHGYSMQVFAYGALAYSQSSRSVLLLPIGDRILGVRGLLAPHAGNAYPDGFAPVSVLHALGWLPSAPQPVRPATAPHRGPDRMPAG